MVERGRRLSEPDWLQLICLAPARERLRLEGLHRWQDRQDSAVGWDLLHRLAREHGGSVHRASSGRPGCEPPLDVSLSHSGGWIAAAVSSTGRVGIDVEAVHDVHASLVRRCLTELELDWLDGAFTEASRNHRFFRLWTAKEAFLKALGIGLGVDPREVPLDLSRDELRLRGWAAERWQLSELAWSRRVCVTVCVERAA
jgi:4'-phosphopantetheinyl transferase